MKRFLKRFGRIFAIGTALLCFFFFVGAGDPSISGAQQVSSEAGENPFEGSTSMRVYWEALEIVGDTPADQLSDGQKEQLEALGVQEDQLPEFLENLQVFLSEEDVNSGKKPLRPLRDLIGLSCGMSGLLLVLAGGAFIGFRRFRQGKSR